MTRFVILLRQSGAGKRFPPIDYCHGWRMEDTTGGNVLLDIQYTDPSGRLKDQHHPLQPHLKLALTRRRVWQDAT